jgi:hypothetical protein
MRRGIRLGSDMVPNHTGIDSRWMIEHPGRFLQLPYSPFPGYNFNCGNLSGRDDVTVQIEEHYFTRSDAAVVFRRIDNRTGETRFIYHGNDGTSMPWNDTAQIDFLNPEAREAVISTIIGVCKQFPIVRFDAAMTLAKRHIQRLWYPEPGHGGDIASRSEHAITTEEFNRRIPNEFWREVVDRCAVEAPGTLLLAEAFWMMEGYFVRTLGMHRVYNSAFMNMLKNEDNAKYRATIKNTLEFDPEILKRFVNFMNNPDEETAVAQFGKGDKYFGICTLLVTMPGLPMFGHGQIEGFEEKYGMEYRRAYRDEQPDQYLIDRHEREIFPLMKKRYLFSGSAEFRLFDFYCDGSVNENVFAYSNRAGGECALVLYNNSYYRAAGWIRESAVAKDGVRDSLCQALGLHGENECFVLMRELRSSLWFIRSSKEIAERGLFAVLDGYQTQVFLDIQEVCDDGRGYWAQLHHELSGRGVHNMEAAKMDLVLAELYAALTELFKAGVNRIAEPGYTQALHSAAENFILVARKYIEGAAGDPFKTAAVYKSVDPSAAADQVIAYLGAVSHDGPWPEKSMIPAYAAGYAALALLRPILGKDVTGEEAARLAFHWQLPRKLAEYWESLGVSANEAWRTAELAAAVLARTAPVGAVKTAVDAKAQAKTAKAGTGSAVKISPEPEGPGELAASIIADNYETEDFRRLLGINRFDDVTWFNKEAFEKAVSAASFFLLPENAGAFGSKGADSAGKRRDRAEMIKAVTESFLKAEKVSGYRLDALLEALSTEKPAPRKAGHKAVKPKTPDKRV